MRILFTAFLILFFSITHSVVDSSHLSADNIHIAVDNQDVKSPQTHTSQIVTSKLHTSDCIQSGNGIGHSASSCSMDHKVYTSLITPKRPDHENIKWYSLFGASSQEHTNNLLRPPII